MSLQRISLIALSLVSLSFTSIAHADILHCQVEGVKAAVASNNEPVVGVSLSNCRTATSHLPVGAFVWAPLASSEMLNELRVNRMVASFEVTGGYFGLLLSVNGVSVGSITPIADRTLSIAALDSEGGEFFNSWVSYLDRMGSIKIAEISSSKQNPAKQVNSFTREAIFRGQFDRDLALSIFQEGPHYSPYLPGVQPSSINVQFKVLNGLKNQAGRLTYRFDMRDSQMLYSFLKLDANESVNLKFAGENSQPGSIECQDSSSCIAFEAP